jgi:hypothetical protein
MLLFDGSLFETAEWCVPGDGDVIGVLQIINKADGPFSLMDEEVCGLLTSHSGVCLRNAKRHATQAAAHRKFKHVADLVKAMQGGNGGAVGSVNSLIFTIQAKAPAIIDADRYGYCITARAREAQGKPSHANRCARSNGQALSLSLSLSLFSVAVRVGARCFCWTRRAARFGPSKGKSTSASTSTNRASPRRYTEATFAPPPDTSERPTAFDSFTHARCEWNLSKGVQDRRGDQHSGRVQRPPVQPRRGQVDRLQDELDFVHAPQSRRRRHRGGHPTHQ